MIPHKANIHTMSTKRLVIIKIRVKIIMTKSTFIQLCTATMTHKGVPTRRHIFIFFEIQQFYIFKIFFIVIIFQINFKITLIRIIRIENKALMFPPIFPNIWAIIFIYVC
uniref:Uncharacterized protein n=1 Tax=Stigeoclonium helveticum TaxID=55999 RepID=A0A6M4SRJ8_STIHE|nr:hypothetical protein [Stigeoclonium helveticum]